jgi:hypothetical protein
MSEKLKLKRQHFVRVYRLQVKITNGKCSRWSYIHRAVHNEMLIQSALNQFFIHLWNYTNSYNSTD